MRKGEQFTLRGKNVDLKRKIITLPRTKSGKTRHILACGQNLHPKPVMTRGDHVSVEGCTAEFSGDGSFTVTEW